MFVVVMHRISDPGKFWETAKQAIPNLPAEIKFHFTFPNADGSKAVCLWEAESLDAIKGLIEGALGYTSKNKYFAVNAETAIGLPG